VHEVEVQVVDAEVLDGLVDGVADNLGLVVGVPQLAGDPDVFAVDARRGDALADLVFIFCYCQKLL
jgi:hypothetical protein